MKNSNSIKKLEVDELVVGKITKSTKDDSGLGTLLIVLALPLLWLIIYTLPLLTIAPLVSWGLSALVCGVLSDWNLRARSIDNIKIIVWSIVYIAVSILIYSRGVSLREVDPHNSEIMTTIYGIVIFLSTAFLANSILVIYDEAVNRDRKEVTEGKKRVDSYIKSNNLKNRL